MEIQRLRDKLKRESQLTMDRAIAVRGLFNTLCYLVIISTPKSAPPITQLAEYGTLCDKAKALGIDLDS